MRHLKRHLKKSKAKLCLLCGLLKRWKLLSLASVVVAAGVVLSNDVLSNDILSIGQYKISSSEISEYNLNDEEVEKLTKQINEVRARKPLWKVGVTEMAVKVMRDPNYFIGLPSPRPQDIQKLKSLSTESSQKLKSLNTTLSDSFDWRNKDGKNYMTPIKDQGNCGACWVFGAVASIEGGINAYFNTPGLSSDLSEQDVINCAGPVSTGCNGGYPYEAFRYVLNNGIMTEACQPFTVQNGSCKTGNDRCPNGNVSTNLYRIRAIGNAASDTADATRLKKAIMNYGPVEATIRIYLEFYLYKGGIFSHPKDDPRSYGLHAITWLGWGEEDGTEYLIGKNSWGTGWGESGYFKYKLEDVDFGPIATFYGLLYPIDPTLPPTPTPTPTPISTPTIKPTSTPIPTPTPTPTKKPTPVPILKAIVNVYASGTSTDGQYPTMELSLNSSTVCQWKNVKKYSFFTCQIFTSKVRNTSDLRVSFINASLDQKVTRTLVVDKVVVDGKTFQTESPFTYTYKTRPLQSWCKNQDGYLKTESTKCNGYFKYNLSSL
jgi:C1A family cysteine protease